MPPGFAATRTDQRGSATEVEGTVDLDPVAVRSFYENLPGVRVIHAEDERVEAELLLAHGTSRTNVIARTACAGRSRLLVTTGPDASAVTTTAP